jgi:hypothetical protein
VQSWAFVTDEMILDVRRSGPDAPELQPLWAQADRVVLGRGWSQTDSADLSTLGTETAVRIRLDEPGEWDLYFSAKPSEDQELGGDPSLRFMVNDRTSGRIALKMPWTDYRLPVDPETLRTGWNNIVLAGVAESSAVWPIRIRTIGLVPSGAADPGEPSAVFDDEAGTFRANRSGTLIVPLRPTELGASIAFGGSARSVPWADPATVRATLVPAGRAGEPVTVDAPSRNRSGLGTVQFSTEAPVGSPGLIPGCLTIDIDPAHRWGDVEIERLDWTRDAATLVPENAGFLPPSPPDDLPDIVVVLLDAARADHFGAYGYERETTPQIDMLATESAVFSQAFAPAPYARASVATLITGLSIQDHGVIEREHVLDDEATTLAEHLQGIGYRTLCYSASPQNSVASGADQGCDVFHQNWVDTSRSEWIDPHHLSALASEELTRESEQPLFLMLHYVPPHEPYAPRAEFDLFGDPGYTGGYDGTLDTIRGISDGMLNPSAADLARIRCTTATSEWRTTPLATSSTRSDSADGGTTRSSSSSPTTVRPSRNMAAWGTTAPSMTKCCTCRSSSGLEILFPTTSTPRRSSGSQTCSQPCWAESEFRFLTRWWVQTCSRRAPSPCSARWSPAPPDAAPGSRTGRPRGS